MEKRHLGVNAEKYSYTKEMSPLNEGIQAEHLEHTQMNKPWYVESCVCLPEGCTQLRASKHSGRLENRERRREESRGALSKEGAQLCWSAHRQRNTQGQQKDARGVSELLPSNSY